MKKLVPDPPSLNLLDATYPFIHPDLIPPDALAVASDLVRGISKAIQTHCLTHGGDQDPRALARARHSAEIAHALIEHALNRL